MIFDVNVKYTELERLLRKLALWIKSEGRKVLKEEKKFQITPAQFDVLQRVYFGQSSMTDISETLGVAKSTITGLVNKLKKGAFLECTQSEEDKRVKILKVTPLGENLLEEVIKRREIFVEKLFSSVDPYLVDEFRKVLRIVTNTLDFQPAKGEIR